MSIKKSIIFLGSKPVGYRCLQHLISVKEELGVELKGLLTKERSEFDTKYSLSALAQAHNISIYPSPDEMPECDIVISVQYHLILKQQHISKARQIAVNLHMAPLPEYRGCNQFSFAIIDGKHEFGTTIHKMDERIDHGDILFEKRFLIPENCWVDELYDLTEAASVALFKESLPGIIEGNYQPVSQQLLIDERGTALHFRNEIDNLKKIDLSWPADKIERHIRAVSMPGFEPPYAVIANRKIYFSQKFQ